MANEDRGMLGENTSPPYGPILLAVWILSEKVTGQPWKVLWSHGVSPVSGLVRLARARFGMCNAVLGNYRRK